MGNGSGLFSPPPTDSGDPFADVPVSDFVAQAKDSTKGQKESHWYDWLWHSLWKSVKEGIGLVISLFVGGLDDIMAQVLSFVTASQGIGQPGMLALMAAVMEDLLGVEIGDEEFQAAFRKGGRLGAMKSAGGKLFDVLYREFVPPGGSVSITSSQDPARAFMGFLIEFAVREGNLSVISELLPEEINIMGGLREYGETLARNLGLGRLARMALRPLMQTMVADPLQWNLNELYQPTLMGAAEAVKLFTEGLMNAGDVKDVLNKHGYRDSLQSIMQLSAFRKMSAQELYDFGKSQPSWIGTPTGALKLLGYDEQTAQNIWSAENQTRIGPIVHAYLTEVKNQFRDGIIDVPTRDDIVNGLPLSDDEKTWWIRVMANSLTSHSHHLSEAQLEHAYLEGLLTLSDVQGYWQKYGYTPEAIQTLSLLLLAKQKSGTTTSRGHVPVKHLTEAELEKAFKSGILDLAAVQTYWRTLGYSAADVATLTKLIQAAPSTSSGTSTAPAVPSTTPLP